MMVIDLLTGFQSGALDTLISHLNTKLIAGLIIFLLIFKGQIVRFEKFRKTFQVGAKSASACDSSQTFLGQEMVI